MAEMTVTQLTEYLKQASLLETSVYKQERMCEEAQSNLKLKDINKRVIEVPINKALTLAEPKWNDWYGEFKWFVCTAIGWFLLALLVFCCLISPDLFRTGMILGGVISVPLLIVGYLAGIMPKKKNKEAFKRALQNYSDMKQKYEKEYKFDLEKYDEQVLAADKEYKQACAIARSNLSKAKAEVDLLNAPLRETKSLLKKLYSEDIIFPKYRNMVAMCTMYEYFASGRCTELIGANGAYNLYESELRQNIIINQLENVNANLEQVKQNQYILYQGISETNQALREISADVKNIVNATYDIAVSSRITAYCSQITAANAQAQTYLALLD